MKTLLLLMSIIAFSGEIFSQINPDSVKIEIKNMGNSINSNFPDYAPVISADGLMMIFTSRRPLTDKEKKKNKEAHERIYTAEYNPVTKRWSRAEVLGESVNEAGRHNSAIALSNDGQTMFIYRDDENGQGDIYISTLSGKEWTRAEKLNDSVNSKDHESSASLSPDGRTIYFCSNREGGQGGRDIWYCTRNKNGDWGKAKNAGPILNTKEDEEGVFIHPDGKTLYFSSKGHASSGGYDIFKTVLENEMWREPENIAEPINSVEDDVFFVLTADSKTAYYASAKSKRNADKDIYQINFTPLKKQKGSELTLFKGIVLDKGSSLPLGSEIEITDNKKNEIISTVKSNSSTGKFLVSLPSGKNYGINIKKEGYLFYSENIHIPDTAAYQEISKTIKLEKLNVGGKIILNNIFYDFDKASLSEESLSELELLVQLMKENPGLKIELSSHTDDQGSADYNMQLSQARAQAVVDFLISKGIDKSKLLAKGYGESQPIESNSTEAGRQLNRRSEFKILLIE